ncbi:HSV-1 UL26-like protein [Gallid alphaherpesvirus 2]|uniref:Capsid scaffolding protein n=1 Tax=Gallid alphaherpesvirus 2 TaxID=10390 RepID=Q19BC6_9ALPH|nr:HSV-1 UL26-like protein [Gallid alphaherpesvirus 2]AYC12127.1 UL26 [Gallid alphaherpesvirus 2]UOW63318.1 UL26 [Gallid alphaherpesvirus 2]UOW63490.1 UL26 [Gallid alphaherpesvirus 2]UOW63655.1 UL26 [Gallid alphaherpesvirus 2]
MNPADHPSVYVAGYLALYGADESDELNIDRKDIRAAIPTPAPLPINIDHRRDCTVGAVLALIDDEHGLFFLGKINCPVMVRTLETAASQEIFSELDNLKPDDKLLYIITNYLPSVSLSSRRLAPGETADETFLAHVALCLLGKRIGTIVTYDLTPEEAIEPFRKLSPNSKATLLSQGKETERLLGEMVWYPSKNAITKALLGTAVNNMLLRDRWQIISERRRMAGITGQKYLQASSFTALTDSMTSNNVSVTHPICENANPGNIQKDEEMQVCISPAQTSETLNAGVLSGCNDFHRLPHSDPASRSDQTNLQSLIEPSMNTQSSRPPGDDFIWVPIKSYNQLVSRNASQPTNIPDIAITSNQPPFIPPALMNTSISGQHSIPSGYAQYGYPTPVGTHNSLLPLGPVNQMGGFQYGPQVYPLSYGQSPLEAKLTALLECMTKEKRPVDEEHRGDDMHTTREERGRRGRKRPYEFDRSIESDLYYPGEFRRSNFSPPQASSMKYEETTGGRHDLSQTGPVLNSLMGAVTSLQKEVERLNGGNLPISNAQSSYGVPNGMHAPVYYSYPPPGTHPTVSWPMGVERPMPSTEGKTSTNSTVIPVPVSDPEAGRNVPITATISQERSDGIQKESIEQSRDTMNASAVAGIHRTSDAGVDVFINQMMAHQ